MSNPPDSIRWTDNEISALVNQFIELRRADPFSNSLELWRSAENKVLDPSRVREINTWVAIGDIKRRITDRWLEEQTKTDPVFVHVETQAAPDYITLRDRLDAPSLVAMLVSKLGNEVDALRPFLGKETTGAPLTQPVSLLVAASPRVRKPRILIMGPIKAQFAEIAREVEEQKIPVELLYWDKERTKGLSVSVTTDYIVCNHWIDHRHSEAARKAIPAGKFFYLQETGLGAFVKKLRDIGAMTPPKA